MIRGWTLLLLNFFFDFSFACGSFCLPKNFNSRYFFWCLFYFVPGPGRVRGFPSPRKFLRVALFVWVGAFYVLCAPGPAHTTGSI